MESKHTSLMYLIIILAFIEKSEVKILSKYKSNNLEENIEEEKEQLVLSLLIKNLIMK